jgi:16S rRNA processing protein RimM
MSPCTRRVELGRIVGAHALKGEVRVRILGDGPDNLLSLPGAWLASSLEATDARYIEIDGGGSGRGGEVRLTLRGISDRDTALGLRGLLVLGLEADLAPLDEDDFYWHQLIGCEVETQEGEPVGHVKEIWATGSHDVLVVIRPGGGQVLVPTARQIMTSVDLDTKRIVIDPLPGLLEA